MKQQTYGAAASLLSSARAPAQEPVSTPAVMAPRPATRVDAALNGGVQNGSMMQAMEPFLGQNTLPTGQVINVSMNAPNPNLEFKEWMARGVVGGIGKLAAWPFKLIGMTVESIALGIVDIFKTILKWALILVLAPLLIMAGIRMMDQVSESDTIEEGARTVIHDGRHAVNGIGKGLTEELPPEKKAARPPAEPRTER